jgi:putative hydrolase of the HAD superfamily
MQNARENGPVRAVIVDFGEVLVFAPGDAEFARMAALFGLAPAEFKTHYFAPRDAYDRGDYTVEGYWLAVAERAQASLSPDALTQARAWDIEMWSRTSSVMLAWLVALRASGLRTGLLSNMPSDLGEHFKRHFAWLGGFDQVTFSHEIRSTKPEAVAYWHCLHGLGVAPEEALFVDDREANVQGARAVGMRAICFDSLAGFERELTAFGFPLLPSHAVGASKSGAR